MKKHIILFTLFQGISFFVFSQTYYVSSGSLNLRGEATTSSEVLTKLSYCDNVEFIENADVEGWIRVRISGQEGYVSKQYVKEGKCIKSSYSYRTGARCRDGSRSSATGRGACSHHGGVSTWITNTKVDYRIEKNSVN